MVVPKKPPFSRIVAAEATAPRDGKFIEKVGTYNPLLDQGHAERIVINAERAQYWLSVGAQPSDRVAGFLATAGLVKVQRKQLKPRRSQPKAKAQERLKEQAAAVEAARLAAEEATAAAAAAPAVEESAPAEEAPAAE